MKAVEIAKICHDMVDYDDLPAEQKMKDSIFLSLVRTLE